MEILLAYSTGMQIIVSCLCVRQGYMFKQYVIFSIRHFKVLLMTPGVCLEIFSLFSLFSWKYQRSDFITLFYPVILIAISEDCFKQTVCCSLHTV